MVINFQFCICTAKTFLKALNFLFTVAWILLKTSERHCTSNASWYKVPKTIKSTVFHILGLVGWFFENQMVIA